MTSTATPKWPQSSFVEYFWKKKKKKKLENLCLPLPNSFSSWFLFFSFQNCCLLKGDPFTPACNCLTLNCTVMCCWYTAHSKLHNSWSHCFREEARNVNTVTEKACVGSTGCIVWRRGLGWVICKLLQIVYPLMIPQLCKRKWKQDFMLHRCDLHNAGNGSCMIVLGFMAEGKWRGSYSLL